MLRLKIIGKVTSRIGTAKKKETAASSVVGATKCRYRAFRGPDL